MICDFVYDMQSVCKHMCDICSHFPIRSSLRSVAYRALVEMSAENNIVVLLAAGDANILHRPCVDCGLVTGCFCDYCLAEDRDPSGEYASGQHTPLCTDCDREFEMCHFCRRDSNIVDRHCVDCGLVTACLCHYCLEDFDPSCPYAEGQRTPLCYNCDLKFDMCHFCRKTMWATPPPRDKYSTV